MAVQYLFENTSAKPIGYLMSNRPGEVARLEFLLYKDGRYIEPFVPTGEPPVLSRERVRMLETGAGVTHVRRLKDEYRGLKLGRYEVRVRYFTGEGLAGFGITPMSFEQKLYLEIR
jgi:hypothetical protein